MKQFVTAHQHTNASCKSTNTKSLLKIPNRSRTEKMMYCLLDYDLVTNHLSVIILIALTQPKTQFVHHATLMNKTLITGFANVLQVTP